MTRQLKLMAVLISTLGSLMIAELILWSFFFFPDPFASVKDLFTATRPYVPSAFPPNLKLSLTVEAGLPGMSPGPHTFSTNNLGFRGDPIQPNKPADETRIFMVGGSTTECLYLNDTDTIAAQLQEQLGGRLPKRAKVFNAGKSGDKSFDHVAMIAHRIVHLQTDVIVVFSGMNDLSTAIVGGDYLHLPRQPIQRLGLIGLLKLAATEFQIPRRLHAVMHNIRLQDQVARFQEIPLKTDYLQRMANVAALSASNVSPTVDLRYYRNNLLTVIGLAKAHGIQIVLMTQATTWNSATDPDAKRFHWMLLRGGVKYREDFMDRALESYNHVLRRLAIEHDVLLFDLARTIPKSRRHFYDDIHFNPEGARFAATHLADLLIRHDVGRMEARFGPNGSAP